MFLLLHQPCRASILKGFGKLFCLYCSSYVWVISLKGERLNEAKFRNCWRVQTIHASPRPGSASTMTLSVFLEAVFDIYMEETHQIKNILKLAPALTVHPNNKNEIKNFQKNDGNALGIEGDEGPLVSEYTLRPLSTQFLKDPVQPNHNLQSTHKD